MFQDDLKTSPNNYCIGVSAEFFKFLGRGEKKPNYDVGFRCRSNSRDYVSPKKKLTNKQPIGY